MKLEPRNQDLVDSIRAGFFFRSRPDPVSPELRPEWRIAILVLSLKKCGWVGRMSLKKAHVVNWAVREKASRETFLRMMKGERQTEDVLVRFDPAFNRALDFAVGERLASLEKKSTGLIIELLPAGKELAKNIEEHEDCLKEERDFFDMVKKVPQEQIEELLEWGID
jgi:hypothetical protein